MRLGIKGWDMSKKEEIIAIISTIGLGVCIFIMGASKFYNNIDGVYFSAIGVALCYGNCLRLFT